MATNTYVALDKITVGSAVASVTFSSIPSGYTDLVIVGNFGTTSGGANIALQVGNGSIDTGSNYSFTYLRGDGSSAGSGRASNQAQIYIDYSAYASSSIAATYIWQVQNYSNTTTNKTVLGRANTASVGTNTTVGLWRSTSAINTIKLDTQSTTFLSGSTFSLYGIAAASVGAKATGGTIYSDSQYYYHVFTDSGTFTPTQSLTCDYLVVAGGGGGSRINAGGGAGGLRSTVDMTGGGATLESALALTSGTGYTVTVGAGGAGGTATGGSNGSNSVFSSITSLGGGGGGPYVNTGGGNSTGLSGGSGGGAGFNESNANNLGGTGTSGQGYAGGGTTLLYTSGGGGGAGAVGGVGTNATTSPAGNGGAGVAISAFATATGTGVSSYYAGGGGAGDESYTAPAGTGGLGGGGNGANRTGSTTRVAGSAGTANTGGGGGGGENGGTNGYAGGSGIVIVRYAK